MDFEVPPDWRAQLLRGAHRLQRGHRMAETLSRIREGSPLERVAGLAGVVSELAVGIFDSELGPGQELVRRGFEPLQHSSATCVRTPYEHLHQGLWLCVWDGVLGALMDDGDLADGPFALNGDVEHLVRLVEPVWAKGALQVRSAAGSAMPGAGVQRGRMRASSSPARTLDVAPWDPRPIPYIGTPTAEEHAERIARFGGNRVVRLWGPSGCGKSTLARAIAREAFGDEARVLRVTSAVVQRTSYSAVLDLAALLRPHLFLIDDLRLNNRGVNDDQLAFLEELHERVPLTLITHMATRSDVPDAAADRSVGLRAGRLDETIYLAYPGPEKREHLVRMFAFQAELDLDDATVSEIVELTEGLGGADLRDLVAERLPSQGVDRYREEIATMRRGERTVSAGSAEDEEEDG